MVVEGALHKELVGQHRTVVAVAGDSGLVVRRMVVAALVVGTVLGVAHRMDPVAEGMGYVMEVRTAAAVVDKDCEMAVHEVVGHTDPGEAALEVDSLEVDRNPEEEDLVERRILAAVDILVEEIAALVVDIALVVAADILAGENVRRSQDILLGVVDKTFDLSDIEMFSEKISKSSRERNVRGRG